MLTNFAQIFLEKVLKREKELLNHPAILCAVYLDRRYKNELKSSEQIQIAKLALTNLYERTHLHLPQPEKTPEPENKADSFDEYLAQGM